MTASVSAAERCTALVARVRDERRNRPAGRDGGSNDPAPAAHGGGSTESVGAIFNNMASYDDVIEEFLRSPGVTGKLVMMKFVDDEGEVKRTSTPPSRVCLLLFRIVIFATTTRRFFISALLAGHQSIFGYQASLSQSTVWRSCNGTRANGRLHYSYIAL